MGNSIGGKKRTAKVMKIDGTTFRLKSRASAGGVLRDHPGYTLLESEEVRRVGLRARPLEAEAPLKPGKLYFLVELPRLPDQRRAWSGTLHVGARERLESLMLSRRTVSDLSLTKAAEAAAADGAVRVRMRLPRAQVAKLMEDSKDSADVAEKIMKLCLAEDGDAATAPAPAPVKTGRKERRIRFVAMPDEIIA